MDKNFNLAYELRKCTECSCSRCVLNGTKDCYIEVAIKELSRYEQAMDSLKEPLLVNGILAEEIPADYLEKTLSTIN